MQRVKCVLLTALCSVFVAMAGTEKVGEEIVKTYGTAHPYPATAAAAPQLIQADVVGYSGATYIAPHFSRFRLAKGDYVIVRSPDGLQSWKYEGLGRAALGESKGGFWAVHIKGDTAIVELFSRQGGEFGYDIDRFARGFRAEETQDLRQEELCGPDDSQWARCYEVSEPTIYEKSKAVARLLIGGTSACTGWLVGSAGHLMTNNHCISTQDDADNTDYEFMGEGSTCTTDCSSFGGCPGTIVASSASLVQTDYYLDFTLVQLPTNASTTYGYLRLRSTVPTIGERAYLPGYPQAWGKRIAVASTHPANPSGFCQVDSITEPSCTEGPVPDIGYWCDTQPGSSGSPYLAYSDNKVVALHHCNQGPGCSSGPNLGVPIPDIIAALGENLPPDSVVDPAGRVALDRKFYGCSATMDIVVRDSNVGAGTVSVTVSSATEPLGETVVLNETTPGAQVFAGSITLTTAPPAADGLLSVTNGDTITVTYIDADDGAGGSNIPRTDTAVVDCVPPVIGDVQVINIGGGIAEITWTTNELSDSTVTYGTSTLPPPSSTVVNAAMVTSHSVHLTGLLPCTNYYFSVTSVDQARNSATNNNGGGYFLFSTLGTVVSNLPSSDVPQAITDFATTLSTLQVTEARLIADVNVRVNIAHPATGDLWLRIRHPDGTAVTLSYRNGFLHANFTDTIFDDQATVPISAGVPPYTGSFIPDSPLSALNGKPANGTWVLEVYDASSGDTGTVLSWSIDLNVDAPCGADLHYQSHSITDSCLGSGSGGGNAFVDPGEDIQMPLTIVNQGVLAVFNVTAALSSTSPHVTITDPVAVFPDIPGSGAETSLAPHFAFGVSAAATCGETLNFQLQMNSNQGSSSDTFSINVGQQLSSTLLSEGFEGGAMPPGWLTETISGKTWQVVPLTYPCNGTYHLRYYYSTTQAADSWVYTQGLSLQAGASYTLSFKQRVGGAAYPEKLSVWLGMAPDDSWMTTLLWQDLNLTNEVCQTRTATFTVPATGTYVVGFHATSDPNMYAIGIDDVLVTSSQCVSSPCGPTMPGEVQLLEWAPGSKESLAWSSAPAASGYRLYRGEPAGLPALLDSSIDSCLCWSGAETSTDGQNTEIPPDSSFFWYLVTSVNAGGEGPPGTATVGPRTLNSSGVCP